MTPTTSRRSSGSSITRTANRNAAAMATMSNPPVARHWSGVTVADLARKSLPGTHTIEDVSPD